MHQSFTGSSRRQRQVNLSGRSQTNPFAAAAGVSHGKTLAAGSQSTIAHAQHERLKRQQDREKINATKTIQRIWRGHNTRQKLAIQLRETWDKQFGGSYPKATDHIKNWKPTQFESSVDVYNQLKLLVSFADTSKSSDIWKLQCFGLRLLASAESLNTSDLALNRDLRQYRNLLIAESHNSRPETFSADWTDTTLRVLTLIQPIIPFKDIQTSLRYYTYLAHVLCLPENLRAIGNQVVVSALVTPLADQSPNAYLAFVLEILSLPFVSQSFSGFETVWSTLDEELLYSTISKVQWNDVNKSSPADWRLWLLSVIIERCPAFKVEQSSSGQTLLYSISSLTNLLSAGAEDLSRRLTSDDTTMLDDDADASSTIEIEKAPLPSFIKSQVESLVDQSRFSRIYTLVSAAFPRGGQQTSKLSAESPARILATYTLTLSTIFPRRADELRMWLQLASNVSGLSTGSQQLPAVLYFWQAAQQTFVFRQISQNYLAVVDILGAHSEKHAAKYGLTKTDLNNDWSLVLLFLNLYSFMLKVMDDDEFFSGGNGQSEIGHLGVSRTRESALTLRDVKSLSIFLKNLAFSVYWHAQELTGVTAPEGETRISEYFKAQPIEFKMPSQNPTKAIGGIEGMTLDNLKGEVTGLLRMIYERERPFLPKDHWLMTSHVDMAGFIAAVVLEEKEHHDAQANEDDDEYPTDDEEPRSSSLIGAGRTQRSWQLEKLKTQQQKRAKRKFLEALTPRREILQHLPFFIPFATRVEVFRQFTLLDQIHRRNGNIDPDQWRMSLSNHFSFNGQLEDNVQAVIRRQHAKIRREHLFEDAFDHYYRIGESLKEPIQITFIDKFGTAEAGIDGGGVTKEFLTSVTKEAFTSGNGLDYFITNDQNLLYPNPAIIDEREDVLTGAGYDKASEEWMESIRDLLKRYEFLGRIIGKCLYEGILVDVSFAGFFLLKWALTGGSSSASRETSYRANINDLRDLDHELYEGLLKLKNYPDNVEDFDLNFTIDDTISAGTSGPTRTVTRDLIRNGANTPVTNENRLMYIQYVARHRLQIQPFRQTNAFLKGLASIIQPSWLSMFNQAEMQTLLGGASSEIDINDLRRNTIYGGVYAVGDDGEEHPCVQRFWKVMEEFSDADRRKVLKFVTSTPRAPLLGFGQLRPRFSIRDGGDDEERLPSTSTCVNLLKLPKYSALEVLRDKLLYAINSGAGFDLS